MTLVEVPTGWPRSLPFPKRWTAPLLSAVAHRESGHTPDKEVAEYWDGGIRWLSLTDCDRLNRIYIRDTTKSISQAGIDNSSARLLPAGVVVLSRDAGVGQSAITTTPMAVSQHFMAWQCSEQLNSTFLYYWLQYLRPELERIAVGSTIKTIGMRYFDRLRVPLPSVRLQGAIAKALEACDGVTYAIESLVVERKNFRDGLARKLLSGEVRFPEFRSDTWQWSRLEDHIRRVSRRNTTGATRVLTASGEHGLVDQRQYFNRSVAGADLSKYYLLKRGEFAYNRSAMKGYPYGATKRLDEHAEGALSTLYLCFSVNDQQIDSDFLLHAFESGLLNRQLRPIARVGARAHGLLNVGEEDYFSISVPFPCLPEQRRIAKVLTDLNQEIDLLEQQRVQMNSLRDGLFWRFLGGAFSVCS